MDWEILQGHWVHEGKVWKALETNFTAMATAVPTTTAAFSLYNGEPAGGSWYVILAAYGIQGGTPGNRVQWGIVSQVSSLATGTAEPTADLDTVDVMAPLVGSGGKYGGAAVIDLGLTVVDDRWAPIGYSIDSARSGTAGTQIYTPIEPAVQLPPGSIYSLEAVASGSDSTVKLGCMWAEVDHDVLDELFSIEHQLH